MKANKSIWLVVFLIAGYITFQIVADVSASKMAQVGPIALPAGSMVFALTFTWRDMLHKKLGRQWARAAIVAAAVCNLFMAFYFVFTINLAPAPFWPNQVAYSTTLGVVWRIAIASILAEVASEWIDTEAYHFLAPRLTGKWQFLRVLGSNAVALPVDSLLFGVIAFAGTMPAAVILSIAWGQIVFKAAVAVVSMPGIYLVSESKVPAVVTLPVVGQ